MNARLGIVAPNGGTYFDHSDLNECRAFLRAAGLTCDTPQGWVGPDNRRGLIDFNNGKWVACHYVSEVPHG